MKQNSKQIKEWEVKIEEVIRNRVAYIGEEIPEYFITDERAKTVYLGYPQEMINELNKVISSLLSNQRQEIIKEIDDFKVDVRPEIKVWLTHKTRKEAEKHNEVLDNLIKSLNKL